MNSGTVIVQNSRGPDTGTPEFQTMYNDFANRIL
jgi:hypothetical protein